SLVVDASGANGTLFREHKALENRSLRYRIVSVVLEAPCPNDVMAQRLGCDDNIDRSCYNTYLETGFIGYGWLFPKDGMMNAGLGTITGRGNGLKERFLTFLERTGFGDLDRTRITAFTIPTSMLSRLWLPRVLFIGDAGGFANALTGGGLGDGISSGEKAAITAQEAVEADDFSGATLEAFERRCRGTRRYLNLRTVALYFLAGAVKRGLDRPFAVKMLLRNMVSVA
ncbi:MAG: hypothetical protein JSW25_08705, partial [Thermoplasmata archaeon]